MLLPGSTALSLRCIAAALALGALAPWAGQDAAASEARAQVEAARQAALAAPFDDTAFEAYLETLPFDGSLYVIEGDIRATREEVRLHLVAESTAGRPVTGSPELLVARHGGHRSIWPPEQRHLTYAVDRESFASEAQYRSIVEQFSEAAQDWVDACAGCGLRFEHRAEFDEAPSHEDVVFIVRGVDAGAYFAAAFFPHDPPARRLVTIDALFFDMEFDPVGVLRHEIGHILGYRHEHIRDIPGCFKELSGAWEPLSPYDPDSVMHYFCGGGGSFDLELTATDIASHRLAYGESSE